MVKKNDFAGHSSRLLDLCIEIQRIPAPTGAEASRARWVATWLRDRGFSPVELDELGNVTVCIRGAQRAPGLLVSAHTDTVFPPETDLTVRRQPGDERIFGPGIGDNSLGVAALLWLGEQLRGLPAPPVDIWLAANVGEEGNGDLRGMRAVVDRLGGALGAAVVIEGMGLARVVNRALASRRFRLQVTAPGGHSWTDFGSASAVHVLVQLAADLTHLKAPALPRTTFNIGVIQGGTSVNTIAQQAELELDLRSENPKTLDSLVDQVLAVLHRYQTVRWSNAGVTLTVEAIGDRPGGAIADDHPLVQAALQSLAAVQVTPQLTQRTSSTDANIPLSRGIPAVCIGITDGGNAHRTDEWIATRPLAQGMQHLLGLTWWAAGWLGGG